MKEIYYIYNNEAIASCVFLAVLKQTQPFDIARSCLILPFLLDDRTVNYFANNNNIELEQMIKEQPRLFISFNKRYLSLLPVTINSLMLLMKSNQISIEKEIVLNNFMDFVIPNTCGDRFNKIRKVLPHFLSIFERYTTTQLYKILNIQL
jgi:hypothetical protein